MTETPAQIPVLIVGGGPVGLACALLLARFEVPFLLVERHPATSTHPKAMAVMLRTAELLRQWGASTRCGRQARRRTGCAKSCSPKA